MGDCWLDLLYRLRVERSPPDSWVLAPHLLFTFPSLHPSYRTSFRNSTHESIGFWVSIFSLKFPHVLLADCIRYLYHQTRLRIQTPQRSSSATQP
jgi:hypothetical protein